MGITKAQRDALDKINVVRNNWFRRFREDYPDAAADQQRPSEWVSVIALTLTHKVQARTIRALVRAGLVERRDSGGFGPEVRVPKESAFYWESPEHTRRKCLGLEVKS